MPRASETDAWIRKTFSGIILNGGASTRMGRDKATLPVGGRTMLERALDVLAGLFDEILVVGRPLPDLVSASSVTRHASRVTRQLPDAVPGAGPLGGIYTGLGAMSRPFGFFVACDMPWLDARVIRRQLDLLRASPADAIVPAWDGLWEPLHAVYSQDCLPAARRQIESGDYRIRAFYGSVDVLFWDVVAAGIGTRPFTNVNTKADLAALLGEQGA